jgi:hypothetical protein
MKWPHSWTRIMTPRAKIIPMIVFIPAIDSDLRD